MAWFRILYAKNAFERSLGGESAHLTPAEGLRAMAAFYREHRAQHAAVADGDDALEFRWSRKAEGLEVALLRRLRRHGADTPPRELALTWRFGPSVGRDAAASGHLVTTDPAQTAAFVREVTASPGWAAIRGTRPLGLTVTER